MCYRLNQEQPIFVWSGIICFVALKLFFPEIAIFEFLAKLISSKTIAKKIWEKSSKLMVWKIIFYHANSQYVSYGENQSSFRRHMWKLYIWSKFPNYTKQAQIFRGAHDTCQQTKKLIS